MTLSRSNYLCLAVIFLLFTTITPPTFSEAQMISMEIPDQIFEGQSLNISVTLADADATVILYLEIDNYSHPYLLEKTFENEPRQKYIPNLEAGTIPWELMIDNVVVDSGEVHVIALEEEGSQWPLVLVAVFFVLAFIGVEMSFKPGRRRKQPPKDDVEEVDGIDAMNDGGEEVEEIIEEPPEEEYESSSISRDETGKKQ